MRYKTQEYLLISIGSILIASAGTLAGFFALEGNYLGVFIGYLSFVIGYKICCLGEHKYSESPNYHNNLLNYMKENYKSELPNLALGVIGVLLIAIGTTIFADVITTGEITIKAGLSGLITFGGYIVAHKGFIGVLI